MNSYNCTCHAGWSGTNCDINIDDCLSQPCNNGGICIVRIQVLLNCLNLRHFRFCYYSQFMWCHVQDGIDGYECSCSEDYTGPTCDSPANICVFNPCENNGNCTVSIE